jgi:hypothetical protein
MANDWFKLEEAGTGAETDPYRPDLKGYTVDGYSGNKTDPNGGPPWIVRVYADPSTLDALENDLEQGEQRFGNVPEDRLDAMFGQDRDASGWESGFNAGSGQ